MPSEGLELKTREGVPGSRRQPARHPKRSGGINSWNSRGQRAGVGFLSPTQRQRRILFPTRSPRVRLLPKEKARARAVRVQASAARKALRGQVLGGAALSTRGEPEPRRGQLVGLRAARGGEQRRAGPCAQPASAGHPNTRGRRESALDPGAPTAAPARGSWALRAPGGPARRRRLPARTASGEAGARTPRSGTILGARPRRPAAGAGRQRAPSSAPAANASPRGPGPHLAGPHRSARRSRRGAPATRPQG